MAKTVKGSLAVSNTNRMMQGLLSAEMAINLYPSAGIDYRRDSGIGTPGYPTSALYSPQYSDLGMLVWP